MTFDSTPFPFQEDGTVIVLGHGRLGGTTDLVDHRDMVTIVRDRVADLVKQGKTLEEMSGPIQRRAIGARTGSTWATWTTTMFVEAITRV